jgi:CheY-like chemotaxis protein
VQSQFADKDYKGRESRLNLRISREMAYVPPDTKIAFGLRKEVKLLVVDDQSEHFAQLQAAAEVYNTDFHIECKLVSSTDEALKLTNEWQPSVVLVDLHVIASTLGLLTQIAEIGPAVIASSEIRISDMPEKVARYGAVGYVTKADSAEDVESVLSYIASLSGPLPVAH